MGTMVKTHVFPAKIFPPLQFWSRFPHLLSHWRMASYKANTVLQRPRRAAACMAKPGSIGKVTFGQ